MMSDSVKEIVKQEFDKFEKPISLKVFTSKNNCPTAADTVKLCKILTELSNGKFSYEEISFDTQKELSAKYKVKWVPTIIIEGSGVRYTGIPAGGEFAPFIRTLVMISTGQTELAHLKVKIKEIKNPIVVKTIVTSRCPHCPVSVLMANQISIESDGMVISDIVEGYQNQEIPMKYEVTGVPATIINGKKEFVGVPNVGKFVDKLIQVGIK